jgi:hypothetical protein
MASKRKTEYLATINPNEILTRVMLSNKTVRHLNKKKEISRKKCRENCRYE